MASQRSRTGRGTSARGTQHQATEESGLWQRAREELQSIVVNINANNDTVKEIIEQDTIMTSTSKKNQVDMVAEERKADDLLRRGVKDIEKLNTQIKNTIEQLEIYRALKEEEARNTLPLPGTSRSARDNQGLAGRSTGRAGTREREKERERERERERAAEREREKEREKEQKEREREREKEREKEQKEQLREQRERDKEQRERERDKERDKDREQRDRDRSRDRDRERDRDRDRDRDRSIRDRDRSDRDSYRDRERADRGDRERDRGRDKESHEKERDRSVRTERSERAERADRGDRADRDKSREKDPYEFDGPGDEMDIEPTTAAASTATGRRGGSSSNSSGNRDSVPPRGSGDRDTPIKADSVEPQPSVTNAGSSMSSAAQRSRVMFVKGQDVVFKPKPANASESAEWFLGKVQQVLGEGKSRRYKVKDEDPDVAPELRQEYRTSASSMIPLPPAGQELSELETGKTVLALYPDSTTFYKAEVMSTNKSLGKVNLRFEGEENSGTLQEVERRFVVEYRN